MDAFRNSLLKLGLNPLEADIYISILKQQGLTGYRIGQLLGKSRANIYNALESMKIKGLVVEDNSEKSKLYYTKDLENYVNRIQSGLIDDLKTAKNHLSEIKSDEIKDGVFQIKDSNEVLELAEKIINRSEKFLLLDLFPSSFAKVKDLIINRAKECRELKIYIKIYSDDTIDEENIFIIPAPDIKTQLDHWDLDWMIINSDNIETLICCYSQDDESKFHSIHIKNIFLSGLIYNGTYSELLSTFLYTQIKMGIPHQEILKNCKFLSPAIVHSVDTENNLFKSLTK